MKKNLFVTVFLTLSAVLSLTSCGSKESKSAEGLTNDDKKELLENLNYRKACELKEFSIAYEIVDLLKKKTSEKKVRADGNKEYAANRLSFALEDVSEYEEAKKVSDEAERYVVLQESLMVLESEGTNGLMRIVGIAKEHNAESWLYSELLDVANKIGDKDLADRIQNMNKFAVSESVIIPETVNISGPLSGYFKIVDKEYSLLGDDISYYSIEFVRTQKGFPAKNIWGIGLKINYIDEKGNVVQIQSGICTDEMISSNVGDKSPIMFFANQDIKAKKFTITSSKW